MFLLMVMLNIDFKLVFKGSFMSILLNFLWLWLYFIWFDGFGY